MLKKFLLIFVIMLSGVLTLFVSAQNYDYHREESPAISWNGVPIFDARMMAAGGISLMASDAFSASINPALIPSINGFFFGASFEMMKHEAFQYWGINQGVLYDPENQSQQNNRLSGLTLFFPFKGLRFSAGWYMSNLLELPSFDYESEYWEYFLRSPGVENTFFAAAAFKWGKTIDIGIKLDYIYGKREVEIDEHWKEYPLTIRHRENHRLTCIVPSIGATIKMSPKWTLGAVLIHPLRGKAGRTLDRFFESEYESLEISDLKSTDNLYRPARIYLGTTFKPFANPNNTGKNKLTLAAEVLYTFWSEYKYIFYSETLPRDMRNTLVMALGMEYGILGTKSDYFFRVGYRLDPQPVTEPETTLHALTGGIGFRLGKVSADIGALYCFGTAEGISQKHIVLNSTLQIHW